VQTEHDLGKAEAGIVDGDAVVASERNLQASTETKAMNDRDRRQWETVKPIKHGVTPRDKGLDFCRVREAAEFIDIRAGDKATLLG
jgi:hypothetical protein